MKHLLLVGVLVCGLGSAFGTELAFARSQATVTWQIGEYSGAGANEAEALDNARTKCAEGQVIPSAKLLCNKEPLKIVYSIIPGGTFAETCNKCRVTKEPAGEILICDRCKPPSEEQRLNLSQCPADARDKIENCHGNLICGVCP